MSQDLTQLLEAAAPEPPRLLNPDDLLRTARRRVTVRRRIGGGICVVVVAAAVSAALLVPFRAGDQSSDAGGRITTPTVSALATTEPLPATVTDAIANGRFTSTGRGTLVRQIGAEQVYLAAVNAGELICIVDVAGADNVSVSCAPRSGLLSTGVYLATQLNDTSPVKALVVAPDGYTTATSGTSSADVTSNLAVLQPAADGAVTLSGAHRPSVTLQLERLALPGPAKSVGAAPTSGTVPLVVTGTCAGLTVVSYVPTGTNVVPADAWRISPGAAGNRITINADSLLYFRASGPCATQLRYLPRTNNIQGPSGTDVPFSFNDSTGFIVAHSTTTPKTATVDLLLDCTTERCGPTTTTLATLTLTITPRAAIAPTAQPSAANPSAAVPSTAASRPDTAATKISPSTSQG